MVGWTPKHRESVQIAKALIAQAAEQHGILPGILIVHTDWSSSMTSKPVASLVADLRITKTHSRPYTSTDYHSSEAHFKTLKYRPGFPARFSSIEESRAFLREFFDQYNYQHHQSGIGLMTPEAVHYGRSEEVETEEPQSSPRLTCTLRSAQVSLDQPTQRSRCSLIIQS